MIIPLLAKKIKHFASKLRPRFVTGLRKFSAAAQGQNEPSKKYQLLLLVPATTFGLGTWQVYRHQWKKELIRELEAKTSAEPVEITTDLEALEAMNYRRLRLTGEFDHSKELYLGPRTFNKSKYGTAEGGYHIITPFTLEETGEKILVNRGWVSKKNLDPATRKAGQIQGPIEMVAVVRKKEKRPPFMVKNDAEKNRWHFLDIDSMAANAGTLPILVDSDAASSVPGGPIGGQTRVVIRNAHLQYIITWYALSAATMYLFYQLRKRPAAMFSKGPK